MHEREKQRFLGMWTVALVYTIFSLSIFWLWKWKWTFGIQPICFKGAKVVIDSNSGPSKGYGFRFGDENERTRAMTEMNEIYCSSRPMHIGVATPSLLGGVSKKIEYLEIIISYGLHEWMSSCTLIPSTHT